MSVRPARLARWAFCRSRFVLSMCPKSCTSCTCFPIDATGPRRRWNRVGHLFAGRYKAFLVERETYLLELARYVVLNPVRARVCEQPELFRWSSYRATAGLGRLADCHEVVSRGTVDENRRWTDEGRSRLPPVRRSGHAGRFLDGSRRRASPASVTQRTRGLDSGLDTAEGRPQAFLLSPGRVNDAWWKL